MVDIDQPPHGAHLLVRRTDRKELRLDPDGLGAEGFGRELVEADLRPVTVRPPHDAAEHLENEAHRIRLGRLHQLEGLALVECCRPFVHGRQQLAPVEVPAQDLQADRAGLVRSLGKDKILVREQGRKGLPARNDFLGRLRARRCLEGRGNDVDLGLVGPVSYKTG